MATKKWLKENRICFSASLYFTSDRDIIDYILRLEKKGFSKNAIVRLAIKEYMKNHPIEED